MLFCEACKGLCSASFKINTQHTLVHSSASAERSFPLRSLMVKGWREEEGEEVTGRGRLLMSGGRLYS